MTDTQERIALPRGDLIIPETFKYIEAFLTFRCQLACSFCINTVYEPDDSKRRNSLGETNNNRFGKRFGEMSADEWISAINRIKTRPGIPVTLGGGEPSLHPGFIDIINGVDEDIEIDILTNSRWGEKGLEKFARSVKPERLKRKNPSPYSSIRVSYHPGEFGMNPAEVIRDVKFLQSHGFDVQVESVLHPRPEQLTAIHHFALLARNEKVDFRVKEFVGQYEGRDDSGKEFSITYGDYSKYKDAAFSKNLKYADCKTTELLIGPGGEVYRCHTDLYDKKRSVGSLLDSGFKIEDKFRPCFIYGRCNPCDVKVKADHKQRDGNTSVEIANIRDL